MIKGVLNGHAVGPPRVKGLVHLNRICVLTVECFGIFPRQVHDNPVLCPEPIITFCGDLGAFVIQCVPRIFDRYIRQGCKHGKRIDDLLLPHL